MKMIIIATLAIALFSRTAAADNCIVPNLVVSGKLYHNVDLCDYAKNAARIMADKLPLKVSNDVTMIQASSIGTKIVLAQELNVTMKEFKANFDLDEHLKYWNNRAKILCTDPQLVDFKEFIKVGGSIEYSYSTADGLYIGSALLTTCK